MTSPPNDSRWPPLPYAEWKDTYATLHMWTQVVGKVALALAPPLNHSWGIALQPTARGLSTRPLPWARGTLAFDFDFIAHRLSVHTSDGTTRVLPLEPRTVASFYETVMATLGEMGVTVRIWPMPVEVPSPVRFDEDTSHHTYDAAWANRWWRVLSHAARVFGAAPCGFVGKCSPVHFFWGAFDLAVTRFSGRPAPSRDGPAFMQEAYSHEVISHGFWPGGEALPEAVFYAYAVPEPSGFKTAAIRPAAAAYHAALGEFILPYEAVRTSASPERTLLDFVESTYDRAASLAGWDRAALERPVPPAAWIA